MKRSRCALALAVAAAFGPGGSRAVQLGVDGRGQALIFPYYSVQSPEGGAYNTRFSVVNGTAQAKALRVRFRESRNSREVAAFNLFLSPRDAWSGTIVPGVDDADPPRLVTDDTSCTSPPFAGIAAGLPFSNRFHSGAFDDGDGTGLDRTREGFIEVIEMATLRGASAAAVTHGPATGTPQNCAALQGNATPLVGTPGGGLSGTLSLIDVANGAAYDVNAVALDALASRPFYRPADDRYPDFNAVEIRPVSAVTVDGTFYRSEWNRPVDAVSATLMHAALAGEHAVDASASSTTTFVVTFPTRQFYAAPGWVAAPFSAWAVWSAECRLGDRDVGEAATVAAFDREERAAAVTTLHLCAAVSRVELANAGSGWASVQFDGKNASVGLRSARYSMRVEATQGDVEFGAHAFSGLPAIGFSLRRVPPIVAPQCASTPCEGGYPAAVPLTAQPSITAENLPVR